MVFGDANDPTFCKRRRFPAAIIQHAVWFYLRFSLSLGDVEEMLPHRGIDAQTPRALEICLVQGSSLIADDCRRPCKVVGR